MCEGAAWEGLELDPTIVGVLQVLAVLDALRSTIASEESFRLAAAETPFSWLPK
jgi:hypothetical protein